VLIDGVFFFGNGLLPFSGDYMQIYHSLKNINANPDSSASSSVLGSSSLLGSDSVQTITIHNTFFFVAGIPISSSSSNSDCPQALNILTLNTAFSSVKTPVIIHDVVFSGEI